MKMEIKDYVVYGLVGLAGLLSGYTLITQSMMGVSLYNMSRWLLTLIALGWVALKFLDKNWMEPLVFAVIGLIGAGTMFGQLTTPGFGLNVTGIEMYLLGISALALGIEKLFKYDIVAMKKA